MKTAYLTKKDEESNGNNINSGGVHLLNNEIYFYDEITLDSASIFNRMLSELYMSLMNYSIRQNIKCPHVNIKINSSGGIFSDSLSMMNYIINSPLEINTYVDGQCASGATLISIVGKRRYMYENSFMLIHQIRYGFWGIVKSDEIVDIDENNRKKMKVLKKIYKKYTKLPMKKIEEILKREIWLTSEECLEYGLVDEII